MTQLLWGVKEKNAVAGASVGPKLNKAIDFTIGGGGVHAPIPLPISCE